MSVKIRKGNQWVNVASPAGAPVGTTKVALLKDQKNNAVEGGSFNSGAWRDRDLTVKEDPQNFVTFVPTTNGETTASPGNAPGYWSLPAGIYKIEWTAPAAKVNRHKTRLVYSTVESQVSSAGIHGSATYIEGGNANLPGPLGTYLVTESSGSDIITITQTTWFKIVHWCTESLASTGFGKAMDDDTGSGGSGPNIYTQIRIEDLATAVKTPDIGTSKVAVLEEQQTSGTVGGTFTSGAWQNRTLNTETDPKSFVSLDSGNVYFSLAAGTYEIGWSAPAHAVDQHQTRLIYATDTGFSSGVGYVYGSSECASDPLYEVDKAVQTRSFGSTTLTISGNTYFKIQHRCTDTSMNTMGFGVPSNYSGDSQVEVYTQVFVKDLATAVKNIGDDYVSGTSKVAFIEHREGSSVGDLGAFTPNVWAIRELNHKTDPAGIVSLDSGHEKFSLGPGTYRIKWGAPAVRCDRHQSKLVYATDSSFTSPTNVYGSSEIIEDGDNLVGTRSLGETVLTLTQTTWFRIEQIIDGNQGVSSKGYNTAGVFSGVTNPPTYSIYTQVSVEDLATAVKNTADNYVAGVSKVATLQDQKSQNQNGGTFDLGWQVRTLTTESDPNNFVTFPVSGDLSPYHDWSLPAGSYKIRWSAPAYQVGVHQTRLVYDDNSSFSSPIYVYGSSENADSGTPPNSQTRSVGEAIVTLTDAITWFRLEHKCQSQRLTDGFGEPANIGTEVYTEISIEDLKTAVRQDGTSIVKQLVNGTTSTEVSHSNAAYSPTGLTGTITLSDASNKVLVMVNQNVYAYDNDGQVDFSIKLVRTIGGVSTDVWLPGAVTAANAPWTQDASGSSCQLGLQATIIHLDTPGNVGPITYHTEARGGDTTCKSQRDGDYVSNIFLQEVT